MAAAVASGFIPSSPFMQTGPGAESAQLARAGGYIATFIVYHTGINVEVGESDGADFFRHRIFLVQGENTFGPRTRSGRTLASTRYALFHARLCQGQGHGFAPPPRHSARFVEAGIGKGGLRYIISYHVWTPNRILHPVSSQSCSTRSGSNFGIMTSRAPRWMKGVVETFQPPVLKKMGKYQGYILLR